MRTTIFYPPYIGFCTLDLFIVVQLIVIILLFASGIHKQVRRLTTTGKKYFFFQLTRKIISELLSSAPMANLIDSFGNHYHFPPFILYFPRLSTLRI